MIAAPTIMSSSVAKTPSMAIPSRKAADDSLIGSYGATAPHPCFRRPSGGEDRGFPETKFNPYRVVVGSAGSPGCALALGANSNKINLMGTQTAVFALDPSLRQVKTGRALINPFDPSVISYLRILMQLVLH